MPTEPTQPAPQLDRPRPGMIICDDGERTGIVFAVHMDQALVLLLDGAIYSQNISEFMCRPGEAVPTPGTALDLLTGEFARMLEESLVMKELLYPSARATSERLLADCSELRLVEAPSTEPALDLLAILRDIKEVGFRLARHADMAMRVGDDVARAEDEILALNLDKAIDSAEDAASDLISHIVSCAVHNRQAAAAAVRQ